MSDAFVRDILNPAYDIPTQTIAYTDTAGTSVPFSPGPNAVQIMVTTAAYVKIGASVDATTANGIYVPASYPVTLKVPAGIQWTASAIRVAGNGSMIVKPLAN